jgi:hypothetical protein
MQPQRHRGTEANFFAGQIGKGNNGSNFLSRSFVRQYDVTDHMGLCALCASVVKLHLSLFIDSESYANFAYTGQYGQEGADAAQIIRRCTD